MIAITSACDVTTGERAPEDALAVLVFHVQGRITAASLSDIFVRHVNGEDLLFWLAGPVVCGGQT